ncbi:hypothetical protein NDU88_005589 [Pleurodeles waltl]|uniref:Uncharacterized protein n=1 Tax=Pleurodeles waltl TaxID=8319 RepID=A0AAV7UJ57_PLEWA|nr:hypothetical protein NDU88_005589 [Pleurodeles waltl]
MSAVSSEGCFRKATRILSRYTPLYWRWNGLAGGRLGARIKAQSSGAKRQSDVVINLRRVCCDYCPWRELLTVIGHSNPVDPRPWIQQTGNEDRGRTLASVHPRARPCPTSTTAVSARWNAFAWSRRLVWCTECRWYTMTGGLACHTRVALDI